VEGKGRSADDLAFRRDVLDMRNCLLVEQPEWRFRADDGAPIPLLGLAAPLFDSSRRRPMIASRPWPPRRSRKSPITRSSPPNG
jgi:hypothetical protein